MRARLIAATMLLAAGCSESPHAVKYDELKGQSQASVFLHHVDLGAPNVSQSDLSVFITGNGKHPKSWRASFMLSVERPKGSPNFLGKRPQISISWRTVEFSNITINSPLLDGVEEDTADFDIELDDLVELVESKQFKLNDKPVTLTAEQADAIRTAVVSAREATAGNQ